MTPNPRRSSMRKFLSVFFATFLFTYMALGQGGSRPKTPPFPQRNVTIIYAKNCWQLNNDLWSCFSVEVAATYNPVVPPNTPITLNLYGGSFCSGQWTSYDSAQTGPGGTVMLDKAGTISVETIMIHPVGGT